MSMGAITNFMLTASEEVAGFTYNKEVGALEGWGSHWTGRGAGISRIAGTNASFGAGKLGSLLRVGLGSPIAAYYGYKDAGGIGLVNAVGADLIFSGIVGTAAATSSGAIQAGVMGGGFLGSISGGMLGSIAGPVGSSVGMSWGGVIGAWATQQASAIGIGSLAGAAMTNPIAWAAGLAAATTLSAAAGAYGASKGSYELLKAGYGHKQRMRHKIDTSGSTAAFMTKNSFTMRSRAMEAIRTNQANTRSALGNEATAIHFSAYKKWSGGRIY